MADKPPIVGGYKHVEYTANAMQSYKACIRAFKAFWHTVNSGYMNKQELLLLNEASVQLSQVGDWLNEIQALLNANKIGGKLEESNSNGHLQAEIATVTMMTEHLESISASLSKISKALEKE